MSIELQSSVRSYFGTFLSHASLGPSNLHLISSLHSALPSRWIALGANLMPFVSFSVEYDYRGGGSLEGMTRLSDQMTHSCDFFATARLLDAMKGQEDS